jgi:hypothetical protein
MAMGVCTARADFCAGSAHHLQWRQAATRKATKKADAPERCKGPAARSIIQVRLVLVHYDQYPEDREAERKANQAYSGRDPL